MEDQESTVSIKSIGIKYGAIAGLISIITLVLYDFAGLTTESWTQWIGYAVTAAIIFFAHKEYKDLGDQHMEYKEGLGIAAFIGLIGSLISASFLGIYAAFINPNYTENMKQQSMMNMEKQGMTDAQIEQAMEFSAAFMTPFALFLIGLIAGFILTMIIALIISIFTKKGRPEFS